VWFRDVGRTPRRTWEVVMAPVAADLVAEIWRVTSLPRHLLEVEYDWRDNRGVVRCRGIDVGRFSLHPLQGAQR
jgi:hypothetical protein